MTVLVRLAILVLLGCAPLAALDVGDQAPPLGVLSWMQGGPIALRVRPTVVEFWATWCAPCRKVDPIVSALARKLDGQVSFAALTSEDSATVRSFLSDQGVGVTRPLAIATPAAITAWRGSPDAPMPYAVLVSTDGVVLWQGHPMDLERVLTPVLLGTWDLAQAKRTELARRALQDAVNAPVSGRDGEAEVVGKALAATAVVLDLDPLDGDTISLRLGLARHQGRADLVRATLAAVPVDDLSSIRAELLAREAITDDGLRFRQPDLALALAKRSVAADPDRPEAYAVLAQVLSQIGLMDEALKAQEAALHLRPDDKDLADDRDYYRRAVELAGRLRPSPTARTVPAPGPAPAAPDRR